MKSHVEQLNSVLCLTTLIGVGAFWVLDWLGLGYFKTWKEYSDNYAVFLGIFGGYLGLILLAIIADHLKAILLQLEKNARP